MRMLREGSQGAAVDLLQLGLHRAGGAVAVDGLFGSGTLAALRAFQRDHGCAADGVAGRCTWDALMPYLVNPDGPIVPTQLRWSSDLLRIVIDGLCARYPFLRVTSIGKSVLCQPLWQLSIGKGSKRVGFNAAHHANEWITVPLVMKFLEEYAEGVARGTKLGGVDCQALYRAVTLDLVPMVNPDGVDLVNGELCGQALRRAEAIAQGFPELPFPSGWKANICGVDVNLCYPARWERARDIKAAQGFDRPAPRDYPGKAPLAAPEARAMYQRTMKAKYRLILAYHTQGQLIYWKFADYNPPGAYDLVRRMEAASGYTPEVTPEYAANAGYKDWFIQHFNRPGYTVEAGRGQNPLPLRQFDEIYRDNLGILLLGLTNS